MFMKNLLILFLLFLPLLSSAQDSLGRVNEIGVTINRYLPDLDQENRPYFFGAEYRRKFKDGAKYENFIFLRAAGNFNRGVTLKPYTSKFFLAGEIGYHARVRKDSSKWLWSWGGSIGVFNVFENVTPLNIGYPGTITDKPAYKQSYFKLALSPRFGVEYALTEETFIQLHMSIGFGTRYFGDIDHLKINAARGFSAQFPSLGIYQKF